MAQEVIHVVVDKEHVDVKATENPILASELKSRGKVPVNYELWRRVPGPGDDERFDDGQKVTVKDGDHFYGMKSVMTPGV